MAREQGQIKQYIKEITEDYTSEQYIMFLRWLRDWAESEANVIEFRFEDCDLDE